MARRSHRLRPAARNRERLYADAFLRTGRPDGAKGKARPGAFARRVPALVRHDNRKSADVTVVCGHWSTLDLELAPNVLMLDSGCLWGGTLTAVRLDDRRVFQVPSRQPLQ